MQARFPMSEPGLGQIYKGIKQVVAGAISTEFGRMVQGQRVTFFGDNGQVHCKIVEKVAFKSFEEMLKHFGLSRCLPDIKTIEEGVSVYQQGYTPEELASGIAGFRLEVVKESPPKVPENVRRFPLKQPYLSQIASGEKTVEGRINTGMFKNLEVGTLVEFYGQGSAVRCIIVGKKAFPSFREMLSEFGVSACLPRVWDINKGVEIYETIPGYKAKAEQFGVLGFNLELVNLKRGREEESQSSNKKGKV